MTLQSASGVKIPDDLVQVGYVSGAYGVAGWVRVKPFSDEADALLSIKTWWFDKPALHDVDVKQVRGHSGDIVAQLVGVVGRDAAEALKGAAVQVPRSHFPALSDDEFYWSDLIGMAVQNLQGEDLGLVVDMMSNGPQSILRIATVAPEGTPEAAAERLIPFVGHYVIKVDKLAKLITVDWGLDY